MKYIYLFNEYNNYNIYDQVGKKAAKLIEITNLNLPVLNGFVITTDACNQFYKDNEELNDDIKNQIKEYINKLEQLNEKNFGDINNPLLLSIKCNTKNEIPGIMNPLLNVGLTQEIVENICKHNDEFIWIWECYLNLIINYSKYIKNIDLETSEEIENIFKNKNNIKIEELRLLTSKLKEEYKLQSKENFPDNPLEQLNSIIVTSFKSWNYKKASLYRKDANIPFTEGMAIYIQPMVFGNINKYCGTGTIYTRDPVTGEKYIFGKFSNQSLKSYININEESIFEYSSFISDFSTIYNELFNICILLEQYYNDMLKIDFVVENNKLFITDVSIGKRSALAALKIACDFTDNYKKHTLKKDNNNVKK